MRLLTLQVYKNEEDSQISSADVAIDSIEQAIRKLDFAVNNPGTPEGRFLRCHGFVSVLFYGHQGTEAIEYFHAGGCDRISDDGLDVVRDAPDNNVAKAKEFLVTAYRYAWWVREVEEAAVADKRPPVFDTETIGCTLEAISLDIRNWIGQNAEAYIGAWQAARTEERQARVNDLTGVVM